jgi:hypothetical protein
MQKDTKKSPNAAVIAAGVAALAAAGYFVFGPNGKNNRKQIKGWTLKMKGDVLERLEKMKEVTPEVYNGIIDDVSTKYAKIKNISAGEIAEIAMDLKKHWNAIARDMKASQSAGTRSGGAKKKTASAKKKTIVKKSTPKKTTDSNE